MRRLWFALLPIVVLFAGCGESRSHTATRAGELHQPGPPVVTASVHPAPVPATAGSEGRADGRVVAGGASCGRERWNVKTATDVAAPEIKLAPKEVQIADLVHLPTTNNGNPDQPREPNEMQVYRVTAILEAAKREQDSDLHLVLRDGPNTMIAEIPLAPACTEPPITERVSVLEEQIEHARTDFVREFGEPSSTSWTTINHQVTVTGVLFDDKLHGQRGVAPTGAEIHPVLSIQDP